MKATFIAIHGVWHEPLTRIRTISFYSLFQSILLTTGVYLVCHIFLRDKQIQKYIKMDSVMDVIKNSEEPEWLERRVVGDLRLWQIMFLSLAGMTTLTVMVCCCFRFRIPRTKQQIEADYQRRKITSKFRQELETIQDAKMDSMSLKDALELLHEKSQMEAETQDGSQHSSNMSPQQSSLETAQPENGQKPEPQVSGLNFVKFATKVAHLSKLGQPKSPTSPTPTSNMDF